MSRKQKTEDVTGSVNGGEPVDLEEAQQRLQAQRANASKYKITKAKLVKGLTMNADYSELHPESRTISAKCTAAVHPDLKTAFGLLDSHLTRLCHQYNEDGTLDHAECSLTGFSISGDNSGVTLSGRRVFEDGKGINLNAPNVRFEDEPEIEHLIEGCKREITAYLFEGKHAPDSQLSMFAEDDDAAFNDEGKGDETGPDDEF